MPPRKRKASDEAGTSPKRSKKDQLAEARARARQWAEEESRKKAGGSVKASSAKKAPAKSPARAPAKSAVRPPDRTSTPSRTSMTTSPRRVAKKTTPTISRSAAKPANAASTPSSTNKMSVAKRQAEARARARAWAAAQEAEKLSSKKNVRAPKSPQATSKMESDDEPLDHEDEDMEEMETDGEEDIEQEVDEDDVVEEVQYVPLRPSSVVGEVQNVPLRPSSVVGEVQHVPLRPSSVVEAVQNVPLRPSSAPSIPPSAPLPFGSPSRPMTWKNKAASMKNEELPPTMAESDLNHHVQGMHDRETQERRFLERQIQEQVFANAMAQTTQTVEQQDVVKFMQQQQPPQYRQDAPMHPEYKTKRSRPYLKALLILAGIGAIVAAAMSEKLNGVLKSSSSRMSTPLVDHKLPPCFVDNYEYADVENPPESPFKCDKSLERIPCPGRCAGGHLLFCKEKYLTSSSDGSRCVLSVSSNATLARVESLLTNWTTQSFCDLAGVDFARKRSKAPVFPLDKVLEKVKLDREILDLSTDFVVEQEDGEYFVGLADEYADTKFAIPTMCWISLLTVDFVISAASKSLSVLISSLSTLFKFSVTYPAVSVVCLVVLLVTIYTRRRQAAQKKLLVDVANIRQLAYQRMIEDTEEHVVLHLRDGIAMDLHPTSKSTRSYVILKVWPRVVADVRLDNRIRKTNRRFGGKPRDVWQWVATPSSRAVKVQGGQ